MDEIDKMLQEHATIPTRPTRSFAPLFTLLFYAMGLGMFFSSFKIDLSSVDRYAEKWSGLAYLAIPFQTTSTFILTIGLIVAILGMRIYLISKNKAHLFLKYNLIASVLFYVVGLATFLLNRS